MRNLIDMINIMSEAAPEFLDLNDKIEFKLWEYTSHLILLSKMLCKDDFISQKGIDVYVDNFYQLIDEMIRIAEDDRAEMCYDYLNEYYANMRAYLEMNEYYEVCANFTRFINTFNDKIDKMNELEE